VSLFARTAQHAATSPAAVALDEYRYSFQQWVNDRLGATGVSETSSGSINTAMRASVVYRCVTLVSGTVATFPIHAKRGRTTLDPAPQIVRRPSPAVRRSVWVEQAVASMLLRGGVYALTDDPSTWRGGYPTRVDLIHPDRVTWDDKDGWKLDNKPVEEYPLGPLWQVPLHVIAGSPKGLNPLEYARKTIYAKLVAQEFGANFFRDGGHPTAILSPETDPGPEGARALKGAFMEATRGNREPVVVPQSVKYTQLQINPDDSQFIDSMRFSDEDLAKFFGVSSAMADIVVSGTSLTYSNITDRREDFKQFTLLLPMYRLEEAMTELIPPGVDVKFNPAGLLKGSITERFATYKTAAEINNLTGETFMSVDEMRDLEDWEELPGNTDPSPVDDTTGGTNA
jgi:HK97 family phage portal protein